MRSDSGGLVQHRGGTPPCVVSLGSPLSRYLPASGSAPIPVYNPTEQRKLEHVVYGPGSGSDGSRIPRIEVKERENAEKEAEKKKAEKKAEKKAKKEAKSKGKKEPETEAEKIEMTNKLARKAARKAIKAEKKAMKKAENEAKNLQIRAKNLRVKARKAKEAQEAEEAERELQRIAEEEKNKDDVKEQEEKSRREAVQVMMDEREDSQAPLVNLQTSEHSALPIAKKTKPERKERKVTAKKRNISNSPILHTDPPINLTFVTD